MEKLDFESLYKKYPRKMGKTLGLEKCKRHVKTLDDFLLLNRSIENFAKLMRDECRETNYIPYFSTFMSQWRDYIEIEEDQNQRADYEAKFKVVR